MRLDEQTLAINRALTIITQVVRLSDLIVRPVDDEDANRLGSALNSLAWAQRDLTEIITNLPPTMGLRPVASWTEDKGD